MYYYNRKYGRDGHLFKERFKSEPVNDMSYFTTLLRDGRCNEQQRFSDALRQIKEDGVERIEGQRSIIQTTGKIDGRWTWTDTKTVMPLTCPRGICPRGISRGICEWCI